MTTSDRKIKVLIIDDSLLIRQLLSSILASDRRLHVVGAAGDPYEARQMIKDLNPDVLTLDIEMPKMDGITFLANLMRLRPMPVVMVSTLTQKGALSTITALEMGAIDFVPKPTRDVAINLERMGKEIIDKVRVAARANVMVPGEEGLKAAHYSSSDGTRRLLDKGNVSLVVIGASTGGTEAIKRVLSVLPVNMPPVVVVQHMPAGFTASFAARLDAVSPLIVKEFKESTAELKHGEVYVAKGDMHVLVENNAVLMARRDDGDEVNRHKPSVDVLFSSAAKACGAQVIGILLTGMGRDGADGLAELKSSGAFTIAQDEKTSVVWGMPRVAIEEGAACEVLPLDEIPLCLIEQCFDKAAVQAG